MRSHKEGCRVRQPSLFAMIRYYLLPLTRNHHKATYAASGFAPLMALVTSLILAMVLLLELRMSLPSTRSTAELLELRMVLPSLSTCPTELLLELRIVLPSLSIRPTEELLELRSVFPSLSILYCAEAMFEIQVKATIARLVLSDVFIIVFLR